MRHAGDQAQIPRDYGRNDRRLYPGGSNAVRADRFRGLRSAGLIESYSDGRIKIHDALRLLGRSHLDGQGNDAVKKVQGALKDIISASLRRSWEPAKPHFTFRCDHAKHLADTLDLNYPGLTAREEGFAARQNPCGMIGLIGTGCSYCRGGPMARIREINLLWLRSSA